MSTLLSKNLLAASVVAALSFAGAAFAQQQDAEPKEDSGASDSISGECASPPPNPPQCDEVRGMDMTDATVEGEVTVGMTVPETVVLLDVPNYATYKTAMINGKRVFIDPSNRTVVEIIN